MKTKDPGRRAASAIDAPPALAISGTTAIIRLCRPAAHNRIDPDDMPVLRAHLAVIADAIAKGDVEAKQSRADYDASLQSAELRRRLAG